MSISQAHSDAARRNGAQSNGPATEEGRRRSSQNARKHSFFASYATLPDEDRGEFDELLAAYTEEYAPQTLTETHFVRELADADWRLQRVRNHLADLQTLTMAKHTPTLTSAAAFHRLAKDGPTLSLLLRYETKFQRQYEKALQQLLLLEKRRAERTQPVETVTQPEEPAAVTEPAPEPDEIEAAIQAWTAFINAPTPGEIMGMDVAFQQAEAAIRAQKDILQNEPSRDRKEEAER